MTVRSDGRLDFGHFMLCAQTPGAEIEMPGLAIHDDSGRVDIGHPAPLGMALGVADIRTKTGLFST